MPESDLLAEISDEPADHDQDCHYGRGYHAGWSRALERVRAELDRLREIGETRMAERSSAELGYWHAKGVLMAETLIRRKVDDEPTSDAFVSERGDEEVTDG